MSERYPDRALLAFAGGTFHTAIFVGLTVLFFYRGGGLGSLLGGAETGVAVFCGIWVAITALTALGLHWLGWPILESPLRGIPTVEVGAVLGAGFGACLAAIAFFPFVFLALFALPIGAAVGVSLGLVDVAIISATLSASNAGRLGRSA